METITIITITITLGLALIIGLIKAQEEQNYIEYARRMQMWEKRKEEMNKMQGKPATNASAVFKATANKGAYKNRPILQPRGGKSWK